MLVLIPELRLLNLCVADRADRGRRTGRACYRLDRSGHAINHYAAFHAVLSALFGERPHECTHFAEHFNRRSGRGIRAPLALQRNPPTSGVLTWFR